MSVVLLHDRDALAYFSPAWHHLRTAASILGMGVDLFFMISGFLMVLTTRGVPPGIHVAMSFLARRVARIWPLYAVATLAFLLAEHHGLHAFEQFATWTPYAEGLAFLPHDPWGHPLYMGMAVGVAWTLCFEFYFYVVFATSLLFGRFRYAVLMGWFVTSLVVVPWTWGSLHLDPAYPVPAGAWRMQAVICSPIVIDFLVGMLGAWLYDKQGGYTSLDWPIVAICVATWVILGFRVGWLDTYGPGGWGTIAAVIFLGCVAWFRHHDPAPPAWLLALGDMSYSLYLTHVLVFIAAARFIAAWNVSPSAAALPLLVLRPLASAALAMFVHRNIDMPLWHMARRYLAAMVDRGFRQTAQR